MPYIGRSTEAFGVRSRFTFLASADDTSVSGNDVNGLPLKFEDGAYVDVFLNGVKLKSGTDYVTTTANTISSLAALAANDEIEVVVFDVFTLADMVSKANGGSFEGRVGFNGGVGGSGGAFTLKNTDTSDDSFPVITLQTGDTDIAQNDVLGRILFQAPDEGTGTDAITSAARIQAFSEGDFSSSNNATSIEFRTATSGVVGTAAQGSRLTLQSDANLLLKDMDTSDGSSPTITLQSGDTDIAQDDVLGSINFQAPDEGTGTDAILVAAGIAAVSEGDFSSSSNATKLSFKTGASEAAAEKMSLSSAGNLTVSGDVSVGDDLSLASDSAVLKFGSDGEIQLIHVADDGLILKHIGTGDGKEPSLTFQAGDNDIAQDDVLGSIFFQAPDEGAGTDAILVAAGIQAVSEGDFSSSSNATSLEFMTGSSEAAAAKMRLTSSGALIIDNSGNVKTKVDGVNDDNEGVKGSGAQLQLHGATPVLDIFSYSTTNGTHGGINFMKSRNNTVGSNTVITTGDVIGSIQFGGFDGADYASIMGKIDFQAGGSGMGNNDTAGEMVFYTTPDGSGGGGSNERLRIESDGTVRITSHDLKVGNNSAQDSQIQFDSGASDYIIGIDQSDSGNFKIANSSDFDTNVRFTLKAGGFAQFNANNNGDLAAQIDNAASTPYGLDLKFSGAAPDNTTSWFYNAADNSTTRYRVYSDGDVVNHDNSYGALSDVRLKQDIVDANSQWDDIKAIKVRNFKKKDDVEQYGEKALSQIGVIAQEIETVSPKLVKESAPDANDIKHSAEFGTLYKEEDTIPEGKKVGDVKEIKSNVKKVSYSVLYMKAIKALQEAMTRIETLETKVKSLEDA